MNSETTKTMQLKAIDKAYWRVARCCEHNHDWDRYIALVETEEKGHRRFCPDGLKCGLTKAQAVRLFAVKELFERFVPAHKSDGEHIYTPTAADFFTVRHSVFGACSLAESCKAELLKEFSEPEMVNWLALVDYVKLNEDPRFPREAKAA